jgi:hypothetical protein
MHAYIESDTILTCGPSGHDAHDESLNIVSVNLHMCRIYKLNTQQQLANHKAPDQKVRVH